ncbi:MAG: FxLYD domain-containing protein [Paramuribaculum sp.]|nr:FxLYD domain-containing protein [Paramuribaculum sp.]
MKPRLAKILIIPMVLAAMLLHSITADAQRTTRRGVKPSHRPTATATAADTLFSPGDSVVSLSGYDKPLRSRRETFFVTNASARSISAIDVTLEYFDSSGRQLHRRTITIPVDIPAGETRKVDTPSWDTQLTFYYRESPPARVATRCYPYSVTSLINYILFEPCSDI